MKYTIGVDVGATKIAAGLVHGTAISKILTLPTNAPGGNSGVLANIINAIKVFIHPKVKSIGIAAAGQIDQKNGVLISSPNMPQVKKLALTKRLQKIFQKPVVVDNDANCFTLAESIYGAGKNSHTVIGLTLGTGVGGGIVIDKKIFHGKQGLAGELGHIIIDANGYECSCKTHGTLEAYASGTAMSRLYHQFTGKYIDPIEIEQLAYKKEKAALRVFQLMSESLGVGIASLINIFNPDIIVLGGGLAHIDLLRKPAVVKAKKEVIYPALRKTKIVQTKLKEKAHIIGASLIAQGR